jgi:NitT/TauT family transport system substrate-binding protein
MKNVWKWAALVVVGIIVVVAIISNSKKETKIVSIEGETKLSTVSIAVNPWIGSGLYYVAEEKGFFKKNGVSVELTDFLDGAVGKQLMASGKVDAMASLTPETPILLADAGVEAQIIAVTDLSVGADGIIVDGSINTLEDLRGKKVAVESGSPSQFFLEYLLKEKGMTSRDLEIVDMPSPDAGAAFVSGAVDAAVTWEPWISQSTDREGGKILVNSSDVPILPGMLIATKSAINTKSTELAAVSKALFEAAEWIESNQAEAAGIMARRFAITEQDVIDQYPTFRFLTMDESYASFNGGEIDVYGLLDKAAIIWADMGFLSGDTAIDTRSLVNNSIAKMLK